MRGSQETVERVGGFVVVFFLPDFSDDMPAVLLGQGPCSWSWGPRLALESECTDCAASSSAGNGEKTAAGGGGRAVEGGQLKGTEAREGECFRGIPTCLSSSHPSIQAPRLGSLRVVMETGRQARPGKGGGTNERKEGERTL